MSTILEDQRIAADIVTNVLLELQRMTQPEASLDMLDRLAECMIREAGGEPYNKGYKPDWAPEPYPATICANVDYEICHAPPASRILKEGSIVTYDVGVKYKSGCGDAALAVPVGIISNRKKRALRYGLQALYEGIKIVRADVPISMIGAAISQYAGRNGFRIIKEFGGHTIGSEMHEDPKIPNFYNKDDEHVLLQEGAVICIEPMITSGNGIMKIAPDGWTAYCPDGQPVVMFEHQILVTKNGSEILTKHILFSI